MATELDSAVFKGPALALLQLCPSRGVRSPGHQKDLPAWSSYPPFQVHGTPEHPEHQP